MKKSPVLLIALLLAASSFAIASEPVVIQNDRGVIYGSVLDTQGAVIVGAIIEANLNQTARKFTTKSLDDGSFSLNGLPFGDYTVTITAPGFISWHVQLNVSPEKLESPHNAVMKVGLGEVRLDVQMSGVGSTVTMCIVCSYTYFSLPLVDLPLADRDPQRLVMLQPGVAEHKGSFALSGRRVENKAARLDGFENRDPATGRFTVSISLDSLAEFNSEYTNADTSVTSNYGQNSAPLLSALSKYGTNQYHGQGFWRLRRTGTSANNFFTNRGALPRDQVTFDQAGFTLGGNVSAPGLFSGKDRAFFFLAYERTRDRERTGRQIVAPLASFVDRTRAIQGPLFRDLLSRNRIPLASSLLGATQDVDGDGLADIGDAAVRDRSSLARHLGLARGEVAVTDKLRLNILYGRDQSRSRDDFGEFGYTPASPLDASHTGELAGLGFVALMTTHTVNDFRAGYLRGRTALAGAGSDAAQIIALNTPVGGGGGVPELPERRDNRAFIFADTFTLTAGAHTIKTGAEFIRRDQRYWSDGLGQGRIYYADALAMVTDGARSAGEASRAIVRAELLASTERERYRFSDLYAFAQDDFRATPRFVINYGTGYNIYSGAIYGTRTDRNNFAPFASFAFAPGASENLIFRGGTAISYAPPTLLPYGEIHATPLYPLANGFADAREIAGSPLPRAWTGRPGALEIEQEFSPNLRTPYTESAFFAVQRSFSNRLFLEIGYHSTFSHRLTRAYQNERTRIDGAAGGAASSDEIPILIASDGNSSYHSMQVRVTSRERRRIVFQAHYTYSKSTDTASDDRPNMFNSLALGPVHESAAALERAPSDYDRRHRAVGFLRWRGPSLDRLDSFWRWTLGDWQTSAVVTMQSGPRVSLYSSGDFFGGLGDFNRDGVLNDRLAYAGAGGITGALVGKRSPADGYFDGRLFAAPGTAGLVELGRNVMPSPGYSSIDVAIEKKLQLSEAHRVELRAEVFNLANRVNFAPPVTDFASLDFGRSVAAGPARMIRFALKYSF